MTTFVFLCTSRDNDREFLIEKMKYLLHNIKGLNNLSELMAHKLLRNKIQLLPGQQPRAHMKDSDYYEPLEIRLKNKLRPEKQKKYTEKTKNNSNSIY